MRTECPLNNIAKISVIPVAYLSLLSQTLQQLENAYGRRAHGQQRGTVCDPLSD
jgi:hypothetical protein